MFTPAHELREIYSKTVFKYGSVPSDDAQLGFILNHIPEDRACRILDAGCGNGRYAYALARLGYRHIHGIDLFEQERLDTQGAFTYEKASVDHIPSPDASFDFAYSNSVIYHLNNPEDAVRELARVLKPGAKLVATVHSKWSLFTAYNLYRMWRGKPDAVHLKHARFLSPFQYRRMLERNGFEIVWIDGYRLSFLAYPIYFRVAYRTKKYLGLALPLAKPRATTNAWLRAYKSLTAYHTVMVARKKS
jgi:SAM-dependent methyltransferase